MMNTFMKRIAITLTAATMTLTAAPALVYANDGMGIDTMKNVTVDSMDTIKYVENEAGANVRTAPSENAKIIKKLDNGAKVNVDGKTSNGWYQVIISYPGGGEGTGYISANLLGDSNHVIRNLDAEKKTVTGTTNYLALRTEPAYDDANVIGKLQNGDTVEIQSYAGDYVYVYAPALNMNGYVNASYLK